MTCMCGHSPEEHGNDSKYPGSTSCTAEGCDCIAYESDEEDASHNDRNRSHSSPKNINVKLKKSRKK